jgi:outer membrane protein TolC
MNPRILQTLSLLATLACLPVTADARTLTLAEALELAQPASEQVTLARQGVERAAGEERVAASRWVPQVSGVAGYTRTLASEFEDIDLGFGDGGGEDLGDLPFGQSHRYDVGLALDQAIYAGGRIAAGRDLARAAADAAAVDLGSATAETELSVTAAFFDAALADRLLGIARERLAQADRTLEQVRAAHGVGNVSEFDLLRAEVERDNTEPTVLEREADREVAHLRLKQLVELPAQEELELALPDLAGGSDHCGARPCAAEQLAAERPPVRLAAVGVAAQEALLRVATAERLPAVGLRSDYGRVAYPASGLPGWDETRTNWTVGVGLAVPLFTGGRLAGQEAAAEANLASARARLDLVQELALLDTRNALARLAAARGVWRASQGTVEQARRAYEIAEVRYREGLSTQLELSDARLLLAQAEAQRAVAERDLAVSHARVRLLPALPLDLGGLATTAAPFPALAAGSTAATGASQFRSGGR